MNRHPVQVVFLRRILPLAAVVRKIDLRHELAEAPDLVLLAPGVDLSNDAIHSLPRVRLSHVLDQADHAALAPSINPPHCDPTAALLLNRSFLVPAFAHSISPYARLPAPRTGDIGIVPSEPAYSFFSIHERSVPRRTSF